MDCATLNDHPRLSLRVAGPSIPPSNAYLHAVPSSSWPTLKKNREPDVDTLGGSGSGVDDGRSRLGAAGLRCVVSNVSRGPRPLPSRTGWARRNRCGPGVRPPARWLWFPCGASRGSCSCSGATPPPAMCCCAWATGNDKSWQPDADTSVQVCGPHYGAYGLRRIDISGWMRLRTTPDTSRPRSGRWLRWLKVCLQAKDLTAVLFHESGWPDGRRCMARSAESSDRGSAGALRKHREDRRRRALDRSDLPLLAPPIGADVDEVDAVEGFELAGDALSGEELPVRVVPQQADEFTCSRCFPGAASSSQSGLQLLLQYQFLELACTAPCPVAILTPWSARPRGCLPTASRNHRAKLTCGRSGS